MMVLSLLCQPRNTGSIDFDLVEIENVANKHA